MKEICSCGAKFAIQRDGTTTWTEQGFARVLEAIKDWRENHRHDMPAPEEEHPTVVESGSSHERLGAYLITENDSPIGFQRNVVR